MRRPAGWRHPRHSSSQTSGVSGGAGHGWAAAAGRSLGCDQVAGCTAAWSLNPAWWRAMLRRTFQQCTRVLHANAPSCRSGGVPAAGGVAIHRHGAAGHGRAAAAGALLLVCLLVALLHVCCTWRGRFHAPGCLINPTRLEPPPLLCARRLARCWRRRATRRRPSCFMSRPQTCLPPRTAPRRPTSATSRCTGRVMSCDALQEQAVAARCHDCWHTSPGG